MKIRLFQCYEVLWIHYIDAICISLAVISLIILSFQLSYDYQVIPKNFQENLVLTNSFTEAKVQLATEKGRFSVKQISTGKVALHPKSENLPTPQEIVKDSTFSSLSMTISTINTEKTFNSTEKSKYKTYLDPFEDDWQTVNLNQKTTIYVYSAFFDDRNKNEVPFIRILAAKETKAKVWYFVG